MLITTLFVLLVIGKFYRKNLNDSSIFFILTKFYNWADAFSHNLGIIGTQNLQNLTSNFYFGFAISNARWILYQVKCVISNPTKDIQSWIFEMRPCDIAWNPFNERPPFFTFYGFLWFLNDATFIPSGNRILNKTRQQIFWVHKSNNMGRSRCKYNVLFLRINFDPEKWLYIF